MVWQVDWDEAFVVGGSDARKLTPNFKLREFKDAQGRVRVHRELVTALQMLRSRFGQSLSILGVDSDGLGARVRGEPATQLEAAAERVQEHNLFERVERSGDELHVRIPTRRSPIAVAQALETAFTLTARFETSGDPFQQVTGDFDDAGLSFGPAQVNFKSGTLQSLFRQLREADEGALRACFRDPDDYAEWMELMDAPKDVGRAWGRAHSTGRNNADVFEPWKSYLQTVGTVPRFRQIMVESILRDYGGKVLRELNYLKKVAPGIEVDHLRCFCALYDLVIQQGSLDKAHPAIERRVREEKPQDQFDLIRIAVEERSAVANPAFQDDCASRRLGILNGVPTTVGERQRANLNFYLLRDVRVQQGSSQHEAELERVAQSIAKGVSLLA